MTHHAMYVKLGKDGYRVERNTDDFWQPHRFQLVGPQGPCCWDCHSTLFTKSMLTGAIRKTTTCRMCGARMHEDCGSLTGFCSKCQTREWMPMEFFHRHKDAPCGACGEPMGMSELHRCLTCGVRLHVDCAAILEVTHLTCAACADEDRHQVKGHA